MLARDTAFDMCEHFLNAQSPIYETDSPNVSVPSNPSHWRNALSPIYVTELGMVKSPVALKQNAYAPAPILVTELGMSIEVNARPQNASSPIAVTVFGITVFTQPRISSLVSVAMTALQLSLESKTGFVGSTVMPLKLQYLKAIEPIDSTLLGMFKTPCKPSHELKA